MNAHLILCIWILSEAECKIRHSNKNSIVEEIERKKERRNDKNDKNPSFHNVSMGQVTKMLDLIIGSNYDSQLRPEQKNKATEVTLNIAFRMLGPIDDRKEILVFTCYLRLTWIFSISSKNR